MSTFTLTWEETHSVTIEAFDEEAARVWWLAEDFQHGDDFDEYHGLEVTEEEGEEDDGQGAYECQECGSTYHPTSKCPNLNTPKDMLEQFAFIAPLFPNEEEPEDCPPEAYFRGFPRWLLLYWRLKMHLSDWNHKARKILGFGEEFPF